MKRTVVMMSIAMLTAATTMAGIVAYWEGESTSAATWYDASTVTVGTFKDGVTTDITAWGSNDGTFGTLAGANPLTVGGLKGKNGNTLSIRITNVSGSDLQLDSLHFDFAQAFANSPTDIAVVYFNGNLAGASSNDLVGAYTSTITPGGASDYEDVDISLSSALPTDSVLANTEFVTFEFQFSNGGSDTTAAGLDNIAIQATVIPEPATVGLIALMGGALFGLRRFFAA